MGSICNTCKRKQTKDEIPNFSSDLPEEINSEREICLQELDKITEFICSTINRTHNAYLESVFLFLDSIRNHLIEKKFLILLGPLRILRLLVQKFREALHEIRTQDSIDIMPEYKDKTSTMVNQLETVLKSYCGFSFLMGFVNSDEIFLGFERISEKLVSIHKEIKEKLPIISKELFMKFSSNISAHFWLNNFGNTPVAKWKEFRAAFQNFTLKTLNLNLEVHEIMIIQAEIDYNNDLLMEADCWDYFYSEIWSNAFKRRTLLSRAVELKEILLSPSKVQMDLRFFRSVVLGDGKNDIYFANNSYFYIQEDKIRYSTNLNLPNKDTDLYNNSILVGKHPKAEISFNKNLNEVSTRQFQIHMKKVVIQKNPQQNDPSGSDSGLMLGYKPKLETWYFLNNTTKRNLVTFLVDEKGFALSKGMIINVNGNSFKINEISPSPVLYADDEVYYVDPRPKGPNKQTYKNPQDFFIDLEFFKNGPKDIKKYQFTVPKKEDFFQISIGSLKKKSKRSDIYIEDEHENWVSRHHCFIQYNPKKACWIIKDDTYNKLTIPFYKTFVFSCGIEEFEIFHNLTKDAEYVARGQRLVDGMKITFVNNFFEVKIS